MLFPETKPPRKKPRKLMHVSDAGDGVLMECAHCGYNSGWFHTDKTVTELKRGLPCPECNKEQK